MKEKPVILGRELAEARQAEAERVARGDGAESPLSPVDRYDEFSGESSLCDPVWSSLDDRLTDLCRLYKRQPPDERAATRRSLSMENFYTLFTFACRAAVFAWRADNPRQLEDGLAAVAMVEIARVDWRDALGPPFVIYAIFQQLGLNATQPFAAAAALAEPRLAEMLLSFQDRPEEHKTLQAAGYSRVDTVHGPGLIRSSGSLYAPILPLDQIVLQLAQLLRDHGYSAYAEIATELPDYWLSKVDDGALKAALSTVVGGASVHARPSPAASSDYASQGIMVFLVESSNPGGAEGLMALARQKQSLPNDFILLPSQCGRLFCLFVARNFVAGSKALETQKSMSRFLPSITRILEANATP
jgi:hypothetical protein